MVDAGRTLFEVVTDENKRFARTLAESIDDILDEPAVVVVETVKGFVENQQFRILDKGSR